ncbi:hypothetical protein GCM10022408_23780 [Hymenobacter fastidiosus]|uniref:Uncharacterized protein n=1 Tax=Hymenobacter fastidiosus TaxID=486264 RepID=A0ABP7SEH0_9BACT
MPKTIEYPRTSYLSAWEIAEVVDDTGGKCAIETCARKLSRKVSGSFKAIIGSAVKFGLVTSKRELLTTTNLFRRIKHAYDKQEEKIYHREAFLHPPLFTQICRKFRNRELPVHMFDIMLIREFGVEEINAQNVAKAFVDGARMVGIIDERNVIVDIDMLATQQAPRRELASTEMPLNMFKQQSQESTESTTPRTPDPDLHITNTNRNSQASTTSDSPSQVPSPSPRGFDAVSSLFGLDTLGIDETVIPDTFNKADSMGPEAIFILPSTVKEHGNSTGTGTNTTALPQAVAIPTMAAASAGSATQTAYTIRITGPGLDTQLSVHDVDDLAIVGALLDKIRRQLSRQG